MAFIFLPFFTKGQQITETSTGNSLLYGKIIDKATQQGIGFASISVLHLEDSSLEKGVLSKENGNFQIKQLPSGNYILKISFLGYQSLYHHFSLSADDQKLNLGTFSLNNSASRLKTIDITATKPTYTMDLDKKVFDVSKSIEAKGGNALDMLRHVPGIDVDIDGKVTLRNGSPVIYIDGKRSLITLDEIPAENIAKIEVITNPSAQFDASGMSGILNIILKKNRKPGINGRVSFTEELRGKYKGGANLNVYRKPFNLSLSYYLKRRTKEPYNESLNRQNIKNNHQIQQFSHRRRGGFFQTGQIGIDFYPDEANTFSLTGSLIKGTPQNNKTLKSVYLNSQGDPDSSRNRETFNKQIYHYYAADFLYKHNFEKKGHEITADLNLNTYSEDRLGDYTTYFKDRKGKPIQPAAKQTTGGFGHAAFFTGQIDYTNPISQHEKIQAGLKTTLNHYKSIYNVYDLHERDSVFNRTLSTDYSFTEKIYAAYLQFSGSFNHFGYELGLRTESYGYSGALPAEGLYFKPQNDKPALYPSLFMDYHFSASEQLQLNYSRRVNRPDFLQRVPFTDYTDPQNLSRGNPDLKPEYTHSFELNYNSLFGQSNLLVSLYFKNINHRITTYTEPFHQSQDTLITYAINARSDNNFGTELTYQGAVTSWWNIIADVNLFHNALKASVKSRTFSNSRFSWYAKISSNIKLPADITLQLSGNYHSPIAIPQGTLREFGYADAAVEKKFFKEKNISITVTCARIFDHKKASFYYMPGLFSQNSLSIVKPYLKINLAWTFGNPNLHLFKKDKNEPDIGSGANITPLPGEQD